MARDLSELVDAYLEENNLYRVEGRQGVQNMCTLARALGYKDPMYFGQLTSKAAIGDLICMLEDNPGLIEAMIEWVRDRRHAPEFVAALESQVSPEEDEGSEEDKAAEEAEEAEENKM